MWKMNPMSGYDIRLCLLFQAYSLEREGKGNPHLFDIRPADDFTKQVCGMHLPLCRPTLDCWPSGKILNLYVLIIDECSINLNL